MSTSAWNSAKYEEHGRFVSSLGSGVVDLLDPQPGERILDLGCGDGALTQQIIDRGTSVLGFDASDDFARTARERGIDVVVGDAHELPFQAEFDAVFSNAALHWMTKPERVVAGVARALKPGGRFVAEMGGHTNIAAIRTAVLAVLKARKGILLDEPKFYPTPAEYSALLESTGLEVQEMHHFPRPVILPTDMLGWLRTFGAVWIKEHCPDDLDEVLHEVSDLLKPVLCDKSGKWTADYVRLRFKAFKRLAA